MFYPWIGDGSIIPLLDGHDIEVQGRQILQAWVGLLEAAAVDRLDVVTTGVAEVDTAGLLPSPQK